MPLASSGLAMTTMETMDAVSRSAHAIDKMLEDLDLGPLRLWWEGERRGHHAASTLGSTRGSTADNSSLDCRSANETVVDLRDAGAAGFSPRWFSCDRSNGTFTSRIEGSEAGSHCQYELHRFNNGGLACEIRTESATDSFVSPRSVGLGTEHPPVNIDQVLQTVLLQEGLLEDREIPGNSLGETPPDSAVNLVSVGSIPSSTRTLRQMRRTGPFGELSEGAQTRLLGGMLYAYGDDLETSSSGEELASLPDASRPRNDSVVLCLGQGNCSIGRYGFRSGSEGGQHAHENIPAISRASASENGVSRVGGNSEQREPMPPGGAGSALAALLQHNLDRVFLPSHRAFANAAEPSAESRWGILGPSLSEATGVLDHDAWDASLMNTARSIRSISSSAAVPYSARSLSEHSPEVRVGLSNSLYMGSRRRGSAATSPAISTAAEILLGEAATETSPPPSRVATPVHTFGGALGSGEPPPGRPLHVHVSDSGESDAVGDEGVVSVLGFDSVRSSQSSQPQQPQDHYSLDETASVSGFAGTTHSNTVSARVEIMQESARTVPGETLSPLFQGGLDVELTSMLQRLAFENISLDESILRSVRRVLQLGTVLTGQRLSDEEIRALPKVVFDDVEQQNCPICLELYRRGEFLTSLQCGHFFHVDCLARWFQRSTQCPLCRSQCLD